MNIENLIKKTGWAEEKEKALNLLMNTRGFIIKGDEVSGKVFAWGRWYTAEEYLLAEKESSKS